MTVSIEMAQYGSTMATRQRGSQLRTEVQEIAGIDSIVLDFQGVLSISNSFADEFFGPMITSAGDSEPPFEVVNTREEVQRVVDRVVERRKRMASENAPWPPKFPM